MLFDVRDADNKYFTPKYKEIIAQQLKLEVAPLLFRGKISNHDQIKEFMNRKSVLGGKDNIEGIVIKNYDQKDRNGDPLMAKVVCDSFKEKMQRKPKEGRKDIFEEIMTNYRTEARWHKAIQHLKENGVLTDSMKDIGPLIKEIHLDVLADSEDEIKDFVFKWAWKRIGGDLIKGFPEFYKNYLAEKNFNG